MFNLKKIKNKSFTSGLVPKYIVSVIFDIQSLHYSTATGRRLLSVSGDLAPVVGMTTVQLCKKSFYTIIEYFLYIDIYIYTYTHNNFILYICLYFVYIIS